MNLDKAEKAIAEFLDALDIDPKKTGLEKTPRRVVSMYAKLFSGVGKDTKDIWGETFGGGNSMVAVKNLPFYSVCEHHLAPFFGEISIVYLPKNGKIAGFGKFAKLVEILSHRPTLQENLTEEIANAVYNDLSARGVLVVISAKQLCMALQGEGMINAETTTSATKGEFATDENLLNEAWQLMGKQKT